jgi:putative Mg2+ transporter-C (MgtC) family protein
MNDVWKVITEEFVDFPSTAEAVRYCLRLIVAALLGGALGYEREFHHKRAGMRTHMLVAVGAALFVLVPRTMKMDDADVSRIIQGLVVGIGFIGGGTIVHFHDRPEVKGLTTAAGIWLTAGIGMTVGLGRLGTATVSTLLALVILAVLPRLERLLPGISSTPNPVQPGPGDGKTES